MAAESTLLPPTTPASQKKKKRRKSKSSSKTIKNDQTTSPSIPNALRKEETEVIEAVKTKTEADTKQEMITSVSKKKKGKKRRKSSSESHAVSTIALEGNNSEDDKQNDTELETMVGSSTAHKVLLKHEEVEELPLDNKKLYDDSSHNTNESAHDDDKSIEDPSTTTDKTKKHKKLTKEERASLKLKKKEEKAKLLSQVPKVDKDGISYTKIQIRRMMRRVKAGLPAVPTESEENERRRLIKLEKMEEEEELAGMLHRKDEDQDDSDQDDAEQDNAEQDDTGQDDVVLDEFGRKRNINEEVAKQGNESESITSSLSQGVCKEPPKKKRRTKAVPSDYTCLACNNRHSPPHWIYDCPDKVHRPGSGKVAKKLRGINDPVSRKVFVSGLPFDVKAKDVEAYFENAVKGGKVMHCKLFLFDDTKRCKGQGIVTFGTDDSAKKALKLNGTVLESGMFNEKKKKKGSKENPKEKKILKLGVSKLLNRTITKGKINSYKT